MSVNLNHQEWLIKQQVAKFADAVNLRNKIYLLLYGYLTESGN